MNRSLRVKEIKFIYVLHKFIFEYMSSILKAMTYIIVKVKTHQKQ